MEWEKRKLDEKGDEVIVIIRRLGVSCERSKLEEELG